MRIDVPKNKLLILDNTVGADTHRMITVRETETEPQE